MELFEDGIGTGRDNKDGEGERASDTRFQLRGGSCSLGFTFCVGGVVGSGTGTGRSSGDDDGEREGDGEGDGLSRSFDARGGGRGGGTRLARDLRSEEEEEVRSWTSSE